MSDQLPFTLQQPRRQQHREEEDGYDNMYSSNPPPPSYEESSNTCYQIIHFLLPYLSLEQKLLLSTLSKVTLNIIQKQIYKNISIQKTNATSPYKHFLMFLKSIQKYPKLGYFVDSLDLSQVEEPIYNDNMPQDWLLTILTSCPQLSHLKLTGVSFLSFDTVKAIQRGIHSSSLINHDQTPTSLVYFNSHTTFNRDHDVNHHSTQSKELSKTLSKNKISTVFPNLKALLIDKTQNLSDVGLSSLFGFFPNLILLNLKESLAAGNKSLSVLSEHCPKLIDIRLQQSVCSTEALSKLLSTCHELQSIELTEMNSLTDDLFLNLNYDLNNYNSMNNITTKLKIHSIEFDGRYGNLHSITIQKCHQITNTIFKQGWLPKVVYGSLTYLSIMDCLKFKLDQSTFHSLRQYAPNLSSLTFSINMIPEEDKQSMTTNLAFNLSKFTILTYLKINGITQQTDARFIINVLKSCSNLIWFDLVRTSYENDFIVSSMYTEARYHLLLNEEFIKEMNTQFSSCQLTLFSERAFE